jgi:ABC-type Fe3+ transport system permease subunit
MLNIKRFVMVAATSSVILSAITSAIICKVALSHNPMQEYAIVNDRTNGKDILWQHLLELGGLWFVLALLSCVAISLLVLGALTIVKKKKEGTKETRVKP